MIAGLAVTHYDTAMLKSELLVTYKPSGIQTHQSSPEDPGFVEYLELELKQKLFLFQRLDKGTSGLLLIARSPEAAHYWTERLKSKTLTKTYLFLTLKPNAPFKETAHTSSIIKERGRWVSKIGSTEPNSETSFKPLKEFGGYQLWEASPRTGKAHQIRLHAQDLGIPILGDTEHGGAPFFRLCLHALKLEDPQTGEQWSTTPAPFFTDLSMLNKPELCGLLDAYHQREQLNKQNLLDSDTYRLAHLETPSLRIDRFGEQLWVYNYLHEEAQTLATEFLQLTQNRPAWIREMKNRGGQPNDADLIPLNHPKTRWQARENNLIYELRADQGLSPGLFLDQRENRRWVQLNSHHKTVLNLFSYTCGFSLAAAAGGAREVVSVDVSQSFLDWGKSNFRLNNLDPENYEFWSADSLDFLKRTSKIGRRFDLIICDPPSFGRSKRGVFRIEKDLPSMLQLIFNLLAPGAQLLLSTNYEQWTQRDFETEVTRSLPSGSFRKTPRPKAGLDFLEPESPILKTMLVLRNN